MELELYYHKETKRLTDMEELTYNNKIAILKILTDIINADKIIHEKETEYIDDLVKQFGLNDTYKSEINKMMTLHALDALRQLDPTLKEMVASMMGKMIVVDKDINYNEVKLYNTICESCLINNDFRVEDYLDYSLSGPFVNPEDI